MKLIFASLISPSARLRGYLQRFLLEPMPGQFIGGGTTKVCNDIHQAMVEDTASGYLVTSKFTTESGFEVLYFNVSGARLVDLDGASLVERTYRLAELSEDESLS